MAAKKDEKPAPPLGVGRPKDEKAAPPRTPTKALQVARLALINANRGKASPGHDERSAAIAMIDAALGVKSK